MTECSHGHPEFEGSRYKDGRCKACCSEQRKRWYILHKAEQDERNRVWREENPERFRALTSRWYEQNKELHLARSKAWSANNLPLKSHYRRVRRARLADAAGAATYDQVMDRMRYHNFECVYCGGPFEEVDHMIPISRGGSNWPANLVPSCLRCNRRKAQKTYKEFLASLKDAIIHD